MTVTLETLAKTNDELKKNNEILGALCADYISVYRVDLHTGEYEIYRVTERLRGEVADVAYQSGGYDQAIDTYNRAYVVASDQEYFRTMTARSRILKLLESQRSFSFRYRVKDNPDGLEHFELCAASVSDTVAVVGFRNIDSAVREEAISQMETRRDIEETLEGARTGLWVIEIEEGCEPRMYADRTMKMLIASGDNATPEQCYKDWFDRIEPDYVEAVNEAVSEIIRTGRAEISYPWNHPVNGKVYVRCGGIPDKKTEWPGMRLKGYHQDITETIELRKRQERKLMEALMEAKRANRVKSEFLSHMSHDIRTPINGIFGMLAIAEKNPEDEQRQQECRSKIRMAARHLLSLINDVLDISKLESGIVHLERSTFTMDEVLESCYQILTAQAEEHNITLEVVQGDMPHPKLLGSALHLRQILLNLISNGIKYNRPEGKVTVEVKELSAKNGIATYQFIVSDTGIGMSEAFQRHLFEPFTQENSDARTNYMGSGLGMAITKKLVEQLEGTIDVFSRCDEGTRIVVTVPLEICVLEPEAKAAEKPEEEAADISGMTVLLVEDNKMNREIAQYMLEDAGAKVINAVNGQEAVDIFSASEPGTLECILMDIMMPVMDGLTAARKIRTLGHADSKNIPIFALSANVFAEDVEKTRKAGMNEHLGKPLDMNHLIKMIASYRRGN